MLLPGTPFTKILVLAEEEEGKHAKPSITKTHVAKNLKRPRDRIKRPRQIQFQKHTFAFSCVHP
jgi:hypothetical protein